MIADNNYPLNAESRNKITQLIQDEILGLGPIDTLLRDKDISDIMINGAKKIFVEKGGRLQPSHVNFEDDDHLMRIIDRIVAPLGRRLHLRLGLELHRPRPLREERPRLRR